MRQQLKGFLVGVGSFPVEPDSMVPNCSTKQHTLPNHGFWLQPRNGVFSSHLETAVSTPVATKQILSYQQGRDAVQAQVVMITMTRPLGGAPLKASRSRR